MSMKAIAATVALALGLIVLAFVLNRAPQTGTGGATTSSGPAQLLDFRPQDVDKIIVSADGETHTAVRDEDLNWFYLTSNGETWPAVLEPSVRSALGDFSGLTSINAAADRTMPGDASSIGVELVDGTLHTVRFSREALGGKLLASVTTRGPDGARGDEGMTHLVNAGDILPLAEPGPAGWRAGNALPGVRNASRVSLTTPAGTIQLARLENQWTVRSPVSSRANEEAVRSLLDTLAVMGVARFVDSDQPDPAGTGLDAPRLVITLEQDVRSVDDEGRTRSRVETTRLFVGGPSDPTARFLYASPSPSSALLMEIPSDRITEISTAPRNYLALTATSLQPEEIGLITVRTGYDEIRERGFRRQRGAWNEMRADGETVPADAALIDELLAFLTGEPGEPEPASTEALIPSGRVTLHDSSGRPLQTIEFAYTADGTALARSGNVDILYYDFTAPELLDLPEFSGRSLEAPAQAPVELPEGTRGK